MPSDVRKASGLPEKCSVKLGLRPVNRGAALNYLKELNGSAERFRTSVGIAELTPSLYRGLNRLRKSLILK
jgi:hypothetical protein